MNIDITSLSTRGYKKNMTFQTTPDHAANLDKHHIEVMLARLGDEVILIPVSDISEVVYQQTLTPVPMMPDHILGVCNIHGQITCVIDPCQVMSLTQSHQKKDPIRFIVLKHPNIHLALRAEDILSLEPIPEDEFIQATQHPQGFFFQHLTIHKKDYRVLYTAALFQ